MPEFEGYCLFCQDKGYCQIHRAVNSGDIPALEKMKKINLDVDCSLPMYPEGTIEDIILQLRDKQSQNVVEDLPQLSVQEIREIIFRSVVDLEKTLRKLEITEEVLMKLIIDSMQLYPKKRELTRNQTAKFHQDFKNVYAKHELPHERFSEIFHLCNFLVSLVVAEWLKKNSIN